MEPSYQESRMILPKNLAILLAAMLVITWVAMLVTKLVYYQGMSMMAIIICGVFFGICIIACFAARFTVTVYDDRLEILYVIRKTVIPKSEIITFRIGELNIIKNYSDWTLKGVKYKTYAAVGEDMGIGLKVTGKRVFHLSSKDPEAIGALLPKED
ncbi:MAG: hypothetical protein IKQ67_06100 [Candidatus Methanomethylophilaceae archaeon]|nr:hypothetical protein [Candidatus Methanomethylophilaceae archaeon]